MNEITADHINALKAIIKKSLIDPDVRKMLLTSDAETLIAEISAKFAAAKGDLLMKDFPDVRFRPVRAGQAYIIGPEQVANSITVLLPLSHEIHETAVVGTGFPDGSTPETSGCKPPG